MLNMDEDITRRLSRALGGPDIRFIPEDREKQMEMLMEALDTPLRKDFTRKVMAMLSSLPDGIIHEVTFLQIVNSTVLHSRKKHAYMITGPTIAIPLDEREFEKLMARLDVPRDLVPGIEEELKQVPTVSEDRLQAVTTLLARAFLETDDDIPYRKKGFVFDLGKGDGKITLSPGYGEIEKMRRVEHRYEYSSAFTEAVLGGNLALAYEFMGHMRFDSKDLRRASNPLRNAKNLLLAMNTQLRTAMQGIRIPPYRLDMVSGRIAREVENAMSTDELMSVSRGITRDYCLLSREARYGRYPRLSRETATLIKDDLAGNISVRELAEALSVNADYLSSRFHSETGETIKEFVNRERCEQAATLLESTSLQIQDIANHVGYNSTSYFSKMFMKRFGMSPKSYRNRGTAEG